jgi:hypothetical protein
MITNFSDFGRKMAFFFNDEKVFATHPPIIKAIRFFTLYLHNMFPP